MMKYNKKLGIIDISIQGMIVVAIIISALAALTEDFAIFFILVLQFFLGIYQISSAIIGAAKGRKWKMYYLIIAVIYIILGGVTAGLLSETRWNSDMAFGFLIFLGVVLPLIMGLTYFILTCLEFKNEKSEQKNVSEDLLDEDVLKELNV